MVITEYSGAAAASASKIDDSQTHPIGLEPIERLIFIKQQQQCSYCWFFPKRTGESNESTSSSNLENDQDPHFFCLRCRRRFGSSLQLRQHCALSHPTIVSRNSNSSNNFSFANMDADLLLGNSQKSENSGESDESTNGTVMNSATIVVMPDLSVRKGEPLR
ncbi:unnamed protein product [Gongylonema pulchrum]|uniref:C2H2-type domain-containing protein n=1 Tax=Gongylonema pulchrum TaxID=637853 RepID=A0A3P7NEP7_9BILA|nr:unnamed protein product [Gongylonema pulchrum]